MKGGWSLGVFFYHKDEALLPLQESYGGKVAESVPPDGTVHPLCGSTIAALKRLLSYESALPVLFGEGECHLATTNCRFLWRLWRLGGWFVR